MHMKFSINNLVDRYKSAEKDIISHPKCDICTVIFEPEGSHKGTIIGIPGGPGLPKEHILPLSCLTDVGYKVVLYDTHNVGDSDSHPEPYKVQTFRSVLDEVIKSYENVTIAGHSWGSMITLDYITKKSKNNIKNLITLAPLFDTQKSLERAKTIRSGYLNVDNTEYMHNLENTNNFRSDKKYSELSDRFDMKYGFVPPKTDFVQDIYKSDFNTNMYEEMWGPEEFVLGDSSTLRNWSVEDKLDKVTQPTLLITGENDMFGYHHLYEKSDSIPSKTNVEIIRQCSHTFFWEKPAHSLDIISDWLINQEKL